MTTTSQPILSRSVPVSDVPASGLSFTVTANEAECAALARFNDLVAVSGLRASLVVRAEGVDGLHVTGDVSARVTQTCVVSLEPFEAELHEPVDTHYLGPDAMAAYRAARAKVVADEESADDEPDPIEHGRIDLGALVAEHLTLGLDPYPKKPGATLAAEAVTEEPRVSPFAVLKSLGEGRS